MIGIPAARMSAVVSGRALSFVGAPGRGGAWVTDPVGYAATVRRGSERRVAVNALATAVPWCDPGAETLPGQAYERIAAARRMTADSVIDALSIKMLREEARVANVLLCGQENFAEFSLAAILIRG